MLWSEWIHTTQTKRFGIFEDTHTHTHTHTHPELGNMCFWPDGLIVDFRIMVSSKITLTVLMFMTSVYLLGMNTKERASAVAPVYLSVPYATLVWEVKCTMFGTFHLHS